MKKTLLIAALLFTFHFSFFTTHTFAQSGEQQLNSQYQSDIREFLEQDIATRQRTMQRRAEQILVGLPNSEKLYDETYISVRASLADGVTEEGIPELNFVYDISYNCRHLEGYTDDYPLGVFDYDSSNSVRAICSITKTFVEGLLDDIFRAGKRVSIKIYSTTDGVELSRVIPYDGLYGNFRYMPVTFNGEQLRVSVDSVTGINNNCQLAYIRAQSVRHFLQHNIRNLARTDNAFQYVTRSYSDTGSFYRRSSIEITVHDAFRETIDHMTADKLQDDYVDFNIPQGSSSYDNAYVLIVANEDYDHAFLPAVSFASNDGEILRRYFVRTLGVPERQVKLVNNASRADIYDGIHWLTDIAQAVAIQQGEESVPQSNIFVYFAGHGFTDFDGNLYLVPNSLNLDGIKALGGKKGCWRKKKGAEPTAYDIALSRKDATLFARQCVALDSLCSALKGKGKRETYPVNRLTVIVDASFDGHQRNGATMLRADRNIAANAKGKKAKRKANKNSDAIVLLAAAADKTAFSFDAQHHGFLTYFLLKEFKTLASQGGVDSSTYQDIYEAVERKLSKESALQGRWQEITGFVDGKHASDWQQLQIK